MKPKEKEFCRRMAIRGEPVRAAREAGFRHPEQTWHKLLCREDIAAEIRRCTDTLRTVYEHTAVCGLYRMAFSTPADAVRLLYRETPTDAELDGLDLSSVAEVKRTKDKSMEIKFFDRMKAMDRLCDYFNSSEELNSSGGLLEAMRLSAQALSRSPLSEDDADAV